MDVRKQERCNKKNSQIIEKFSIIKDLTTSITRFFTTFFATFAITIIFTTS